MHRAAWVQARVLRHGEAHAPGQVPGCGRGGRQGALPAHLRSLPGAGCVCCAHCWRRRCARVRAVLHARLCAPRRNGVAERCGNGLGEAPLLPSGNLAALCPCYSAHWAACESGACVRFARCWAMRSCGSATTRAARRRWTSTSWRCGLLPVHSGHRARVGYPHPLCLESAVRQVRGAGREGLARVLGRQQRPEAGGPTAPGPLLEVSASNWRCEWQGASSCGPPCRGGPRATWARDPCRAPPPRAGRRVLHGAVRVGAL